MATIGLPWPNKLNTKVDSNLKIYKSIPKVNNRFLRILNINVLISFMDEF